MGDIGISDRPIQDAKLNDTTTDLRASKETLKDEKEEVVISPSHLTNKKQSASQSLTNSRTGMRTSNRKSRFLKKNLNILSGEKQPDSINLLNTSYNGKQTVKNHILRQNLLDHHLDHSELFSSKEVSKLGSSRNTFENMMSLTKKDGNAKSSKHIRYNRNNQSKESLMRVLSSKTNYMQSIPNHLTTR